MSWKCHNRVKTGGSWVIQKNILYSILVSYLFEHRTSQPNIGQSDSCAQPIWFGDKVATQFMMNIKKEEENPFFIF